MLHGRSDYNSGEAQKKIPEDEPVFLLRAKDQLAAGAVKQYAKAVEIHLGAEAAAPIFAWVKRMDEWPDKKMPDVPEGVTQGGEKPKEKAPE